MSDAMNAAEVMRMLRIGRTTLGRLIEDGTLRGFKRGKVVRVARASVERLLMDRRDTSPAGEFRHG